MFGDLLEVLLKVSTKRFLLALISNIASIFNFIFEI